MFEHYYDHSVYSVIKNYVTVRKDARVTLLTFNPGSSLLTYVPLGGKVHLNVLAYFLNLQHSDNHSAYLIQFLKELNEVQVVKTHREVLGL